MAKISMHLKELGDSNGKRSKQIADIRDERSNQWKKRPS